MKLEFLADGSPDCPLIRLYGFQTADAQRLKELFDCLAAGSRTNVSLHEQLGIEPVAGCRLNLQIGKQNIGIVRKGPLNFELILTAAGWSDMASLAEPFCEAAQPNAYQWLNEDGEISLLLSPNGEW
ncbi:MAG TPA: hypothetical protein VMB02_17045 [Candidatus Aquilonibacter sp.]|nr:hypothetical protein [Candidatus Aquilonibacter sp.]